MLVGIYDNLYNTLYGIYPLGCMMRCNYILTNISKYDVVLIQLYLVYISK